MRAAAEAGQGGAWKRRLCELHCVNASSAIGFGAHPPFPRAFARLGVAELNSKSVTIKCEKGRAEDAVGGNAQHTLRNENHG